MTDNNESNPVPIQVTLPLVEYTSRAYLLNNRQLIGRLSRTLNRNPIIRTQLQEIGGLQTALTSTPEDLIATEYSQRFLNLQNSLDLQEFFGRSEQNIPIVQELAAKIDNTNSVTTAINEELQNCCDEIKKKLDCLDSKIEDKFKKLNTKLETLVIKIINETSEEVANKVVGESFYRYCATTTYMPTLILVFKEQTNDKYPRRSQLKFKLNKKSDDITEEDIEKLRKAFKEITDRSIEYGTVRCNYVSEDKSFKNVMYASREFEAKRFLSFIYPLLGHQYDEKNLSFTKGRNRAIFNRRTKPLDGVNVFSQDYSTTFKMGLYRAVLQVNNLEKPILIFRDYKL